MADWAHAGPSIISSFLASLVEFVEALTIVLAVGITRGWRPALIGTAAGVAFLTVLVAVFGPALQKVPISVLQVVIGVLLLLFGMRWLRKAALRSAGVLKLHDEEAIFARETAALGGQGAPTKLDKIAVATTFKAVVLEGLEVVFIVIATGAVGKMLIPATLGAVAAGGIVIALGLMLHKPLARVPENTLKFAVGVLLSAFGAFWFGEGIGLKWPGADKSLFGLAGGFLLAAYIGVLLAKRAAQRGPGAGGIVKPGGNA